MKIRANPGAAAIAAVLAGTILSACEKPPPPPPPAPKRTEAPPPPEPVRADAMLQSMKVDARVQFPQSAAPSDESVARAVISFADALAKGDSDAFRSMLDSGAQAVLDKLVASGGWDDSTGKAIEAVRVSKVSGSASGGSLVLAVQEARGAYPLQWAYVSAGGKIVFSGMQSPNVVRSRASEFDGGNIPATDSTLGTAARPSSGPDEPQSIAPDASGVKPSEPEPPASTGDRRRGTPNGPVTVPGTGRPGGG